MATILSLLIYIFLYKVDSSFIKDNMHFIVSIGIFVIFVAIMDAIFICALIAGKY